MASLQGNESAYYPWEERQGLQSFKKEIYVASRSFYIQNKVVHCPSDFTFILNSITEDILAFQRENMTGNPNTETLQSVENPERLLRNKNKEKIK